MANREPKLGDMRITGERSHFVFCGGEWWFIRRDPLNRNPILSQRRFKKLFGNIIREARENGVHDAIAVVQKLSDEWTGCTLDDVYNDAIAFIREKTGVKP